VREGCARIEQLLKFLFGQWGARGFTDTAYDRLGGAAGGFLKVSLRSRGPYPHATPQDVVIWQRWCREHFPEMLEKLETR
jgi:hypothetical protein